MGWVGLVRNRIELHRITLNCVTRERLLDIYICRIEYCCYE